jgi:hypothetical protein
MWKEVVVAYFKALYQNLPEGLRKTIKKHQIWKVACVTRIKPKVLMLFFWVLTPYRLVGRFRRFRQTFLHLQGYLHGFKRSAILYEGRTNWYFRTSIVTALQFTRPCLYQRTWPKLTAPSHRSSTFTSVSNAIINNQLVIRRRIKDSIFSW